MANLAVTIRGDGLRVPPGTPVSFQVDVRNLGTVVERYRCELVGLDRGWWDVRPESIELFPERRSTTERSGHPPTLGTFTVTLHVPRTPQAAARTWPFGARVTAEHDPDSHLVEESSLEILPFSALTSELRPVIVRGRRRASAKLHITNNGNHPEVVQVTGSDPADRLRFRIGPAQPEIPPGGSAIAKVRLSRGRFALRGSTDTRPFTLTVRSLLPETAPIMLPGTLEGGPRFSFGLPVALLTLAGLGFAATVAAAAFLRPPAAPAATSAAAISTPVPTSTPHAAPNNPTPAPPPTPRPDTPAPPTEPPTPTEAPPPPPPPGPADRLAADERLDPGDELVSPDGAFRLAFRGDGLLVLYRNADDQVIWIPPPHTAFDKVVMQGDGNFVAYPADGTDPWSSGTAGHSGASIQLQDDGNLVIYDGGQPIWASNDDCGASGRCLGTGAPPVDRLGPSELFARGQHLVSAHGEYRLSIQEDGNLVLYRNATGDLIWTPPPHGPIFKVMMQDDGDVVAWADDGSTQWETATGGHPGATLLLQDDGNLVIHDGDAPIWSSNDDCRASGVCPGS